MKEKKLFLVDVSDLELPRKTGRFVLNFSSNLLMYVIASDYNEAFHKATFKIEAIVNEQKQNKKKESILDDDGSLIHNIYPTERENEPKIVGIKLVEEIVVW